MKVNFDCEGVGCNTTAVVAVEEEVCDDEGAAENAAREVKAAAAADEGEAEAAGEEATGFGELGRTCAADTFPDANSRAAAVAAAAGTVAAGGDRVGESAKDSGVPLLAESPLRLRS